MSNLEKLISKAKKELDDKELKAPRVITRKYVNDKRTSIIILMFAIIAWSWHLLSDQFLDDDEIRNEIETLAFAAQQSIYDYTENFHHLPAQLPDPSLRMIFQYRVIDAQSNPPEFVLQGHIENITTRWNSREKRG